MNMKNPLVSVIIPTYNRAHLVERAINSVLNQTYQDFEIIVVDDCSNDDTEAVIKRFHDPRIRYIRHEKNQGGSAARNTGIRAAHGEIIAFLDSDDEWMPEKLFEQVRVLREDPNCDAVYTDIYFVHEDGKMITHRFPKVNGNIYYELLKKNVVGTTSTVLLRRQCFDTVGLFDESLPSCQDWDMWIRISKNYKFRKIDKPLVKYKWHQVQISKNIEAVQRGHEKIMEKYKEEICALGCHIESMHYFHLGNLLCHLGKIEQGRKYLFKAVLKSPLQLKNSIYLLSACLGKKAFEKLARIKRIVFSVKN